MQLIIALLCYCMHSIMHTYHAPGKKWRRRGGGGGSALCSDFFGSWLLPGVLCVSTRDAPLSPFFGDESSARGYMKRRDTMREEERRKKQNIRRSVEYTLSVRSLVRSGVITSLRSYTVEWPTCTNYREADSRPRPRLLPPANRRP